jgi:hypothetical protein
MVRQLLSLTLMSLFAVASATAQTNTPAPPPSRSGEIVVPDSRSGQVSAGTDGGAVVTPSDGKKTVIRLLDSFKEDAKRYLEKREELKRKIPGASKEERDALREQMKLLREQWLERSRELREEYKDRKAELETKLKDHKELFDDMRDAAKERARDAGERPRRGGD